MYVHATEQERARPPNPLPHYAHAQQLTEESASTDLLLSNDVFFCIIFFWLFDITKNKTTVCMVLQ
jgi:hypothetical protein